MTTSEIFAAMPPALAADVLEFNHANEKRVYHAAVETIAQARKVRSVFIERMPRAEQHALLISCLARPQFTLAAVTLLQTWLLKKHSAVLASFLDSLGIRHEGGAVEDMPQSVEDAALKNAVETVLARHPHDVVAVYLNLFQTTNSDAWPNLGALLKEDPRLQLKREA